MSRKNFMAVIPRVLSAIFMTTIVLELCLCQITPEILPEFLAPLENHTVIQGREVTFTCIVNHLQDYRVAWIKSDSRAILAIHTRLIAHNPRLAVTHNGHNTWKLHVSNVQKNDSGTYMCQVNTEPMLSQMGYMEVVIPPDIIDDKSGGQQSANEGGSIKLRCVATGLPQPNVTWKREKGQIVLRGRPQTLRLDKVDGEYLELNNVTREDMGTYLCIASNGIPPSVSKRYSVIVNFAPTINAVNNFVSAPVNTDVVLQCLVEASPAAMNTWLMEKNKMLKEQKLLPTDKYSMSENQTNDYTWQMKLTIRALTKSDFGEYICASVNALGTFEGNVTLSEREMDLPLTTTPKVVQQHRQNELRPGGRKKQTKSSRNRSKFEQQHHQHQHQHQHQQQRHRKEDGLEELESSFDHDGTGSGDQHQSSGVTGTTRRNHHHHRTERPLSPTRSSQPGRAELDEFDDENLDDNVYGVGNEASSATLIHQTNQIAFLTFILHIVRLVLLHKSIFARVFLRRFSNKS